jgi:2-polyprenyl-6-methoxyphenol hydroxylase-like FAD-dependent oxidoreductase
MGKSCVAFATVDLSAGSRERRPHATMPGMDTPPRVLVVGAGIAGLALAHALHRRCAITADIVERSPQWRPEGSGIYLPGNAVRALRLLGLEDAVTDRAYRISRQRVLEPGGRVLTDIALEPVWGEVGACVGMLRSELHEAMREGISQVRLGVTVTSVQPGEKVAVGFTDGRTGEYDLVVGADGIRSVVRQLAFAGVKPRFLKQICWRFVAEGFPELVDWTARIGTGRTFLTLAAGGGQVYCYADFNTGDPAVELGDWRELFAHFADPVPALLSLGKDAYRSPIEEVVQPRWTAPGVVLVGDAAHASSPNMAQGAAMALEDVYVLAGLLAVQPIPEALRAFEERRRSRVRWVQSQTHRRDRTRRLPSFLRNLALAKNGQKLYRSNYAPLLTPP